MSELIAGTMAGFGICAVGHPFDTVKILMQMQPDKYTSMVAATRETIAKHGLGGLYKGVGAPLIGNGFYNAVQFAVFSRTKQYFTDGGRKNDLSRIAAAGAFTGIFVALVEGPQDLFKSQIQAQMMRSKSSIAPSTVELAGVGAAAAVAPSVASTSVRTYAGVADCAKSIIAERGIAGATQGLTATIARNIVGVSAYFFVYEAMRKSLAGKDRPVSSLSSFEVLISGGFGGLGYWVLCYPLDIIKSAIQTDAVDPAQRKYPGTVLATGRQLWAEGGVKRFTAGLAPCLARSFPANAAGFAIYESTMKMLNPPLQ